MEVVGTIRGFWGRIQGILYWGNTETSSVLIQICEQAIYVSLALMCWRRVLCAL